MPRTAFICRLRSITDVGHGTPGRAARAQGIPAREASRHLCAPTTSARMPTSTAYNPRRTTATASTGTAITAARSSPLPTSTACRTTERPQVVHTPAGWFVASGALDDRLGAFVILDLLPRLDIVCDVLLTTDEEVGASTASDFATDKEYNWLVSFDRGGTDVVMYQYEMPEYVELVESCGAQVGLGSFSDICELEQLGVAGFNWGVGYRDYHGPRAHAWLEDTFGMVARFVEFHRAYHDEKLPYSGPADGGVGYADEPWLGYWDDGLYVPVIDTCPACHEPTRDGFCADCGVDWDSQYEPYGHAQPTSFAEALATDGSHPGSDALVTSTSGPERQRGDPFRSSGSGRTVCSHRLVGAATSLAESDGERSRRHL